MNDNPDPSASSSRLQPGQQHVQQLQANPTIDPSLMQSFNPMQQQVFLPPQPPYPASVNPSLLQAPQQPAPVNEVKPSLAEALLPLLASKALESGSRAAVNGIVDTIDKHGGPADVEPSVRRDLMSRIRDNAGPDFLKAWVNHQGAMEIVRSWLKACITGKDSGSDESNNALIALLYVIHRLPLTVELLKESKIGRYIKHLQKSTTTTSAIKSVADQLEKNWLNIVLRAESEGTPEAGSSDDTRGRKRKITESESSRDGPPAKKAATGAASTTTKVFVKKETKSGTSTSVVTHAKSDSSFFSAPKAKPKLPSFKKAPMLPSTAGVKQEPVANMMSINPFQDAMKSLNKGRSGSPVPGTPPGIGTVPSSASVTDLNKKSKKRVHFPPETQLRQIRIVTRVVYDDDPTDGGESTHNVRDLDRAEGAAMHQSLFQELIDWFEPPEVELPVVLVDGSAWPESERGKYSEQKNVQEAREQKSLAAMYQTPEDIPPSPAEPPSIPDEPGEEPQILLCGSELDALSAAPPSPPPQAQVSDLLSRLNPNANPATPSAIIPQTIVPEPQVAAALSTEFNSESLQHILAALGTSAQPASLTPPTTLPPPTSLPPATSLPPSTPYLQTLTTAAFPNWNTQASQLPQPTIATLQPQLDATSSWTTQQPLQSQEDRRTWGSEPTWRGGSERGGGGSERGRGRGGRGSWRGKRRLCSFFAQGKCRYGDQCDFLHERE